MNSKKRILALLMCICMIFTLLPFSALADNEGNGSRGGNSGIEPDSNTGDTKQIVYGQYVNGEWAEVEGLTAEKTYPASDHTSNTGANITYSKTAAKAEGDNTYEITLNVTATAKKTAVALIIDASYASRYCAECGKAPEKPHKEECGFKDSADYNPNEITYAQSFLKAEKDAAKAFIDNYAGSVSGVGRYVQIVSYQGTAAAHGTWYDVSTADGKTAAIAAIDDVVYYLTVETADKKNLQQGLKKAYDCFADNTVNKADKYAIVMTNSWPNAYTEDGVIKCDNWLASETYGVADEMRDDYNCTVFTAANANTEPYQNSYREQFDKLLKQIANEGCAYEGIRANVSGNVSWLNNTLANDIIGKLNLTSGFTVTDPMGKYMELLKNTLIDCQFDNNTIVWTPSTGKATDNNNGSVTVSYTLTYKVKVNTNGDGFKYDKWYATNGDTLLKIDGEDETLHFNVPGVMVKYIPKDWNINVSKTATELKKDANGDYKTNVTLSVPGVEESLATDVVFVLDKSTSADLENQAIAMLNELKEQAVNTGAKVKVGVVIFNKIANVTKLTDISTTEGLAKIEAAIKQEIKSGTNTHAGLLAGKELLDNDTGVAANRKHLIFVSDGVTYLFCKDGDYTKAYTRNFNASLLEGVGQGGALSELDMQYGGTYMSGSVPKGSIEAWLSDITSRIGTDKDNKNFDYEYTGQNAPETQQMPSKDCVSNVEKALYLTQQTYLAAQKEGYNCYSVLAKNTYKFGTDFMDMLAGGKTLSFGDIKDDILYAVGKGSYVKDVIGDKFELFDLEPDHNGFSSLKLYVGDKELTNRFISANVENGDFTVYYFADNFDTNTLLNEETHSVDEVILEQSYRFKVDYNVEQKLFTWTFGEAVSNFEPVQLSYTLQLTQPATAPGTYGQLDLNGDGYIDGKDTETKVDPNKALYTNKSATLTPVDSDKHQGTPVTFPMPSVEYTVRNPYRPPVNPGIGDEIIVEITGNSDSVVYDGAEHSVKGYTVKISDPRYTEKDFTFTGKAEASGVNAGTYEMGLKAEQFKNTNARFTNVKFVIKADGVLTITPKELTITAGSKTEYGPTPVTCDEWTVSGLAAGDKVESVKITGIQSVPGSSPNVPSDAVIKNAKGEDVTKNYAIKYVNGTLTMLEVLNKEDHFNYIIGTPEGLSLPTANVTRAEVATIFFRLMTDDARAKFDSLDNSFSDVAKGKWYNRAISTLANAGIIKGDPAGTYRPGDPITRAEMAAIIARFGDFKEGGKTFSDISGHWAQKYIELAASNGWINGNPDGTFKPNNNITRAETVAMINRVLNRQTESNDDLLPVSQMTNWSDNMDTAKWYYRDMQEATNNHKAERVGNSIYEKWTEKLPDIDWASYQI